MTTATASPLRSLSALKKIAHQRRWFQGKRFVYYGATACDSHMLSHFLPVSAVICDDDGDEVRTIIENAWGAKVFSYERKKRVRHGDPEPFEMFFLHDEGDRIMKCIGEWDDDVCFVPFSTTPDLQEFLFHKGRHLRLLQNPVIVQNYFDYKARLAWRAAKLGIPIPPESSLGFLGSLNYEELTQKYGGAFVVQVPLSSAGMGTDIIRSKVDFDNMVAEKQEMLEDRFDRTQVKITRFLPGPPLNCTASICNGEIVLSPPCVQIVGEPALTPVQTQHSGSDFSLRGIPPEIRKQMIDTMIKVGRWMGGNCYRGNFGIDFLTTTDKSGVPDAVFVSEINARLVSESQYMADFEAMRDVVPLSFFHVAEFMNYEIRPEDILRYNEALPEIEGSNLIVCTLEEGIFRCPGTLKAGRYVWRDNAPLWIGPGISLSDTKNSEEFVVTSGVPCEDLVIGHPRYGYLDIPLFNVMSRESVLDPNDWKRLNPKWQSIIHALRNAVALAPCPPRSLKDLP
ncbi:hypothetical protein HY522_05990 [bacterium]|nr:hypothetical protein [bacterium]